MRSFYFSIEAAAVGSEAERPNMETSRERVISISLNEADWQAFTRVHPHPVDWLRERIQESLRPGSGQAIVDQNAVISSAPAAVAAANTTSATTR
jgi:hypothetical protein